MKCQSEGRVRAGKILVSPAGPHILRPVPTGLIHDWIAAAFFPNTKLNDVLAVVRNYDRYKDFYKPSVVESKSLAAPGEDDKFSMFLVHKEVVAKTALDSEYQACYQKLDDKRWYGMPMRLASRRFMTTANPEKRSCHPIREVVTFGASTASPDWDREPT
jgi:hypothetical protein